MSAVETSVEEKVDVHYVNTGVPLITKESVEYYIEHGDTNIPLEELLQEQEILHQSFETNKKSDAAKASSSSDTSPGHDDRGDERRIVEEEGESLQVDNVESQLATDEALARSLQELENQLAVSSVNETTEAVTPSSSSTASSTANRENSTDTTAVVIRQDNIDPDYMTYEQRQLLGEEIGTENKGLSEEVISYLTTLKYEPGMLSREDKHEECVICCMEYKKGDMLITLPCDHAYHSDCVTQWLKINKACPVCKDEVFGS